MSRGYDSFNLDDFGRFAPERSHEKSKRREYPEEREQKRGTGGPSNSEQPRELPKSPAGDLRDETRNVYRDREHS